MRRWIVWGLLLVVVGAVGAVVWGYWNAGYRAYVIHTGSMSPTLVPGDVIIDRPANSGFVPGDIITFRHSAGPDLVTHRVTDVTGAAVHTKGDANETADVWNLPPDFVQGVVEYRLPGFGYAVVFLRQPTGFASFACSLVALIFLWRLFFPPPAAGAAGAVAAAGATTSRGRHRRSAGASADASAAVPSELDQIFPGALSGDETGVSDDSPGPVNALRVTVS